MTAAISHHYNPQVYLRQFTSSKAKNELWEYNLTEGTVEKSTPQHCGCEDYYNSVALEGGGRDDETIEEAFHPLENNLPKLFEAIRNQKPMTDKLWNLFFAFAAIQEVRCPSTVHSIDNFLGEVYQAGFEMMCKASVGLKKKLAEQNVNPLDALAEFEMKPSQGSSLLLSLEGIKTTVNILTQIKWGFVCAPNGKFFFTSDRPVCHWVSPDKRTIYNGGPTDRDAEITFPLSRRICACGHWTKSWPKTYNEISADVVDTINRRTVRNARNFVYGPTMDTQILGLVQGKAKVRRDTCKPDETK